MEPQSVENNEALGNSARILVADDSTDERSLMARYLRRVGYDVSEASDGRATIDYLQNNEVNVLLLDLNMPGLDGFDVLGYLQKHRRGLPVILLSGMAPDQIQQQIHGLPQKELPPLMLKPIDLNQLTEVLELQLNGELPKASEADRS